MERRDEQAIGKTEDVGWQTGAQRAFFKGVLDAWEAQCENSLR
jgi:hypothetical protein